MRHQVHDIIRILAFALRKEWKGIGEWTRRHCEQNHEFHTGRGCVKRRQVRRHGGIGGIGACTTASLLPLIKYCLMSDIDDENAARRVVGSNRRLYPTCSPKTPSCNASLTFTGASLFMVYVRRRGPSAILAAIGSGCRVLQELSSTRIFVSAGWLDLSPVVRFPVKCPFVHALALCAPAAQSAFR